MGPDGLASTPMNHRFFAVAAPLLSLLVACAADSASAPGEAQQSASSEAELTADGRGLMALDHANYALNAPNVARELAESGVRSIPNVLVATSSTSPYTFAATLQLSAWSGLSTTRFDASTSTSLYVRVEGPPGSRAGAVARRIFDGMTAVPTVAENGAAVRRSSKRSVTCARYSDGRNQCFLGPFDHVDPR